MKNIKDLQPKGSFIQTIKDIVLKAYVIGTFMVALSAAVFYAGAQFGQAHADNNISLHNHTQTSKK